MQGGTAGDNLAPSQLVERSALALMALGPLPVQVLPREELSLSGSQFISWQGRQMSFVPRGSFVLGCLLICHWPLT